MRTSGLLPVRGLALAALALPLSVLHAQTTPAPAQPSPATPAVDAPIQNPPTATPADPSPTSPPPATTTLPGGFPAVSPPVPNAGPIPARPAYRNQAAPGQSVPVPSVPVPQPSPAPVVVPSQAEYTALPPYQPYGIPDEDRPRHAYGSTYIPVDSWVYDSLNRLYSLGYANTMFLSLRPYTRQAVVHILQDSEDAISEGNSDEAKELLVALEREVREETPGALSAGNDRGTVYGIHSAFTQVRGISGQTLRDSYDLGQTIVNDYGRPYQKGFNSYSGFSFIGEHGRFSFDFRGELQQAPSGTGYSPALRDLVFEDFEDIVPTPQNASFVGVPYTNIGSAHHFRVQEANVSFFAGGHEFSFGKSDEWIGPAHGGAFAWSNNAENIYGVRVNRTEPLHIPILSYFLGPIRYDFTYGSLKGHTFPNHPYAHSEILEFSPTKNFQFGFQRTIVFGGAGHEPVTLHTFLKGFFSINDTTGAEKFSRDDPGARFGAFNFSWRLPFLTHYATLYADSEAHDDVTPPTAPRRAAYRVGVYLSQIPAARKFDFRVEGITTDPPTTRSISGTFNYFETIQRQAYTNQGFIFGDWIGREAKGGQVWLTYHPSGNEMVQIEYLKKNDDKDFSGTTQNSFKASVVKRFHHDDVELNAWFQYERFKAPLYLPGITTNTATAVQLTFFPVLKSRASR